MWKSLSDRKKILGNASIYQLVLISLAFILLIGAMSFVLPPAVDWHKAFRPAARELVSGRSPYNVDGYFNAPWALLPLIPLALLPENVGRAIAFVVSLAALTFTAHRLGARPLAIAVLLVSPPVMHGLLNGNIDWLAAIGFVLPPQIGLFFITVKPQMGIAVGIFWMVEAYRKDGWREVMRVFGPITVAMLLSFVLFGLWPLRFERELDLWWNASLWPTSIPVGLALLVSAVRKGKIEYAMGASPCLAPYVLLHSWVGALLAIVASLPEMVAAVIGLWILVVIRAFS
jgi:hypothetical protein